MPFFSAVGDWIQSLFNGIVTAFNMLFEYITLLFTFIGNIISAIAVFFQTILQALTLPQILAGYCFPILGASVVMVFLISVVKIIINR